MVSMQLGCCIQRFFIIFIGRKRRYMRFHLRDDIDFYSFCNFYAKTLLHQVMIFSFSFHWFNAHTSFLVITWLFSNYSLLNFIYFSWFLCNEIAESGDNFCLFLFARTCFLVIVALLNFTHIRNCYVKRLLHPQMIFYF